MLNKKPEVTKHAFTKKSPNKSQTKSPSKFENWGIVERVELDLADLNPTQKKTSVQRSASDEKVKQRIEKKHLYKTYKTNAIIHEKSENSYESHDKEENNNGKYKSPSQKIMDEEMKDHFSSDQPQKLTSDNLRASHLGAKRNGLGSSLINFAMQDLTHTSKVKSEYNTGVASTGKMKIGGMFNKMNMGGLGGMMMPGNPMAGQINYNADEDNCSLISGNTFQGYGHFANPMSLSQKKH